MPVYKVKVFIDKEFEVHASNKLEAIESVYDDLDLSSYSTCTKFRNYTEEELKRFKELERAYEIYKND